MNLYAYVRNDPINRADPTGTEGACVSYNNCENVVVTERGAQIVAAAAAFTAVGTIVDGVNTARAVATGDPVAIASAVVDVATKKIDAVADVGKAVKSVLKGMNNPKTSEAVKAGQKAHKAYNPGEGFKKEQRLPSGGRMDGYNRDSKVIKELKPDTPTGRAAGEKQLERYCAECNREYGDGHKTILDTYNPADYL